MIKKRIEVAVGVIKRKGKVLVGQRLVQDRYFQKWEFPGGKLEGTETPIEALNRELSEELGIGIISTRPMIALEHDYPDRHVRLYVYEVSQFSGEPVGVEGQALQWLSPVECLNLDFLEANTSIVRAVQLPSFMFVTDISRYGIERTVDVLHAQNERYHSNFIVQLREAGASSEELREYLNIFRQETDSRFIFLNGSVEQASGLDFDGVQLNRHRSKLYSQRLDLSDFWVGASCHNAIELKEAEKFADYALLSPVRKTSSHPEVQGMGWKKFRNLTNTAKVPCYALGGLALSEVDEAWLHGAQGIAAISSVWGGE